MSILSMLKKIDVLNVFGKYRARKLMLDNRSYAIFSFYKSNVSPEVVKAQKDVFKSLHLSINQIQDDVKSHGEFLNSILCAPNSPEFLIFFDIDCIPLSRKAIEHLLSQILDKKSLAGAAQTASHLMDGKNLYVGPFYLGISKTVYKSLGCPDMQENSFCDVGGLVTAIAKYQGETKIKFWYPTHVETIKWNLYNKGKFGLGTTYENLVYHAFESRLGESDNSFIRKCKEVIAKQKV